MLHNTVQDICRLSACVKHESEWYRVGYALRLWKQRWQGFFISARTISQVSD